MEFTPCQLLLKDAIHFLEQEFKGCLRGEAVLKHPLTNGSEALGLPVRSSWQSPFEGLLEFLIRETF